MIPQNPPERDGGDLKTLESVTGRAVHHLLQAVRCPVGAEEPFAIPDR